VKVASLGHIFECHSAKCGSACSQSLSIKKAIVDAFFDFGKQHLPFFDVDYNDPKLFDVIERFFEKKKFLKLVIFLDWLSIC